MVNLSKVFAEKGLEVDMVLAKAEGPYLSEVPATVRVIDLKASRVLFALPALVRYLRRERPSALLSTLDHANIIAIWARKLALSPCRLVVRIAANISQSAKNAPTARGRLIPYLVRKYYPWVDAIVAVSQGIADDLVGTMGLPKERICVIYNPVVTPELFEKARELLDHPWFAPGQPPVVLSVGRLVKQKDYPTLIRAFAMVRAQCPARLMILGEGEERPKLEALIRELGLQNDVSLPGFVDNPYTYMAKAAVFVLSSAWEGLPNALIEAMAVGTPVIATDCPSGPREILEDGKWGRLVPVGDVLAVAESICYFLTAPNLPYVSKRAKDFGIEQVAENYLKLLIDNT